MALNVELTRFKVKQGKTAAVEIPKYVHDVMK